MIDVECRFFYRRTGPGMRPDAMRAAVLHVRNRVYDADQNDHDDRRDQGADLMWLQAALVNDRSFFRFCGVIADRVEPRSASEKTIWRFFWHDTASILRNAV